MAVVLIILVPVFGHLSDLAIQRWDESRLAVNAFEMNKTHNWLVPTFRWEPDMWNTKPPLLIWLQVASLNIFGINELAIRIPSALAAVITCLFLYTFLLKRFENRLLAIAAPAILIVSQGYTRLHGIRTGDYDALLAMFTTFMLAYFYLYLKDNKPRYLIYAMSALSLACLTKGVPALMFGPAMLAMAILHNKLKHILTSWEFYIGLLLFIIVIPGYYILREQYNPGYFAAVTENELGGRFLDVIENHRQPWPYYFWHMYNGDGMWLLLAFLGVNMAVFSKNKDIRDLAVYLSVSSLTFLLILSFAQTKLDWYTIPVLPLLSILAAMAVHAIVDFFQDQQYVRRQKAIWVLIFTFGGAYSLAYSNILHNVLYPPLDRYDNMNAAIEFIRKDIAHEHGMENVCFINREYLQDSQQETIWYSHVNDWVSTKNINELEPGDFVIVRINETIPLIKRLYKCTLAYKYYNTKIYKINALVEKEMKPVTSSQH